MQVQFDPDESKRKSLHDTLNQTVIDSMIALKVNSAYELGGRPWPIVHEFIQVSAV